MSAIRLSVPLLLLTGLTVAFVGRPSSTPGQTSVDESFQPIVVAGAELGTFLGTPVAELFVYVYRDGTWMQIPFQFDERAMNEDGDRTYTAEGDGLLEADEELVFMWKDMGEQAPSEAWVETTDPDRRVQLTAGAGDGNQRFAYLFHSSELTRTFTQDYVRFSGAAQRIIAERYEAGFLDSGVGLDELRLNNSGIDIFDRTKIRLEIVIHVLGIPVARLTCNEDNLTTEEGCDLEPGPIVPLKDGPVRLIWGERGGFAYGSLFQTQNQIDLPDLPLGEPSIGSVRLSWDFNEQIVATSTPSTYLDANISEPVAIDGQPDNVPEEPVPSWRQISHHTGTMIVVADLSLVGGTQHGYYKDDETVEPEDTGDQRSYGDTGFVLENPNARFRLDTSLLILPPTWENVGAAYAGRLAAPPSVTATLQTPAGVLDHTTYLPTVRR